MITLILITSFICFLICFKTRREKQNEEYPIPPGKIYEPHREKMTEWMKKTRSLPYKELSVQSFDNLTLYGRYYEFTPDSPIEIMFHGYRGSAERDLCGGIERCFKLGRSALIVDQRGHGKSEGRVITFGVKERKDVLSWVERATEEFGKERKLILTGISMGAATVTAAADLPLPENVAFILADCGFTSPKEIIQKCTRDLKLPPKLMYPFIRLGAIIFGGFDPNSVSSKEALKNATKPVIFFHGEDDNFVPCQMSRENYEVCKTEKKLITIPGAGHGLGYMIDPDGYINALKNFQF